MSTVLERSGRHDGLHGDEDYEVYSERDQRLIAAETSRLIRERITSAEWWTDQGVNPATTELDAAAARALQNLDGCIKEVAGLVAQGNCPHTCGLLSALSNLQRAARGVAIKQAERDAEDALERGELA